MPEKKHASCACPVSYCLPVTYNFFPKVAGVGKMMEAIEYLPFDGQALMQGNLYYV